MRQSVLPELKSSLRTPLVRNSAFLLATALLGYGLGFLFWLLVARLNDTSVVGLSATLLSTILFLATVATLGLQLGLIRFLPDEKNRVGLINAALTAVTIASLVIGVVFVLGVDVWAPALSSVLADPWVAALCVLSLAGFAVAAIIDAAFLAARRAEYGMVRHAISNVVRLSLLPIFGAAALGALGVVLSWTIGIVLSVGMATWLLLPRLYPHFRVTLSLRHLSNPGVVGFSAWNQATLVVGTAAASLLPLVILNVGTPAGGPDAAAYFYAAFTVASILYVVPGAFTTSLFVEGSYSNVGDSTAVRHATWLSLAVLVLGTLAVILLGPWILGFFGPEYAQAGYGSLILLSLASPLVLANAILATDLRVAKRVQPLLAITVISTVAGLFAAYILLPAMGILGASAGFAVAHGVALPLYLLDRRRSRRRSRALSGGTGPPGA